MELNDLQSKIHQAAVEHGWWDAQSQTVHLVDEKGNEYLDNAKVPRSFGDLLALVHSEVSEALEAYRENGLEEWEEWPKDPRLPEFEGVTENDGLDYLREHHRIAGELGIVSKPEGAFTELGDAIIRILDMAGFYGVDMQEIIERKMAYNETRSFRHGGKKL